MRPPSRRLPPGPLRLLRAAVPPALVLIAASCGDGQPTLFSAPAEVRVEGTLELQGVVGEAAGPLPTLRVVDSRGNPVPGVSVALRVEDGGGSVTPETLLTDEGGRVRPSAWILGQGVGTNVLVAELGSAGEVRIEAWAAPGPPDRLVAASTPLQMANVGTEVSEPPVARLVDRFDNPLEGFQIVFEPQEDSGEVEGALGTTGPDGEWGVASWTLGTRSGDQALRARLAEGQGGPDPLLFVASAQPGPPVSMEAASATFQEATAGSGVGDPPAVLLLDEHGNPVQGRAVTFTVTEGGGFVSGTPAPSNQDGIARLGRWQLGSQEGTNRVVASREPFPDIEFEAVATPIVLAFTIEAVHLNQATQRLEGDIGGVAGRPGLLRAVVRANQANDQVLNVLFRLYQGSTLIREELVTRSAMGVPTAPNLDFLSHTWNLPLTASEVVAGLRVEAILDPEGNAVVASTDGHRYPEGGGTASLDVQDLAPLRVVFIPVELTRQSRTGNVHPGNVNSFLLETRRWIPSHEIQWEVQGPMVSDADLTETPGWQQLLQEIQAKRTAEEATDEYYHAIVPFFQGLAWGGYAYVNGTPSSPFRSGISYDGLPQASRTVAHELGHNLGRWHSPCGNPSGVDAGYPHGGAAIGPTGYNVLNGFLMRAEDHRDYMSYCGPGWTSDYTYESILQWRRNDPLASPEISGAVAALGSGGGPGGWTSAAGTAAQSAPEPGLLIWGRVGSEGAVLHPAFALEARPSMPDRSGPHQVRGLAADGRELFRMAFAGEHPAHSTDAAERHFTFFVPLSSADREALDRIELTSPHGQAVRRAGGERPRPPAAPEPADRRVTMERIAGEEVRLQWEGERFPMAMLRDPATGRVLGFARGGEFRAPDRDRRIEGAEILLSDGVRSGPAARR